jgi:hypothetical protein
MAIFFPPRAVTAVLLAATLLLAVLTGAVLGLPVLMLNIALGCVALVTMMSFVSYFSLPLRLAGALAGAISASVLGLLWTQGQRSKRLHWFVAFLSVNLITVASALLVASVLSDTDFFMEYNIFRGVKMQYTVPLLIMAAYLALKTVGRDGLRLLKKVSPSLRILFAFSAVAVVAVYLYRSGDVDSISRIEAGVRTLLEKAFVVRPRFKELLAHPALMLSLYWRERVPSAVHGAGVLLAAVGHVSIVNTFLHLRTPLALSLLRTTHGMWIGTLLGLLAVVVTSYVVRSIAAYRATP